MLSVTNATIYSHSLLRAGRLNLIYTRNINISTKNIPSFAMIAVVVICYSDFLSLVGKEMQVA